jgi:hypothetical protein
VTDAERPGASGPGGRIPEAWIGRGVVMLARRHRDGNEPSRHFYPLGVVGRIRPAQDDEQEKEEERPRAVGHS